MAILSLTRNHQNNNTTFLADILYICHSFDNFDDKFAELFKTIELIKNNHMYSELLSSSLTLDIYLPQDFQFIKMISSLFANLQNLLKIPNFALIRFRNIPYETINPFIKSISFYVDIEIN